MSDLYSNPLVRDHAELLVRQNVHACVSQLIGQIAKGGWEACQLLDIDYEDELMPLLESLDFETPADAHIDDMEDEDLREYLTDQGETVEGDASPEDLRRLAKTAAEAQGYEDFCSDFGVDPDRNEVYEHWIVDGRFAARLEEKGETIARDFLGLTIWGRPTTGQSIAMDAVILDIASDALKDA